MRYCLLSVVFLLFILGLSVYANTGLSLEGQETLLITKDELVGGDIVLSGDSVLTIRDATVVVNNTEEPRTNILLSDNARLILENATLWPLPLHPDNLYVLASGNSRIEITNSAFINLFNLVENAGIVGNNARIYSSTGLFGIGETDGAFGIVQLSGNAIADFTDSTIGSFGIFFDKSDTAELSNLRSQKYDDFNLQRDSMLSTNFNIILKNSTVLPVKISGPFERGWTVFADPDSNVLIRNSSLNKFVFQQFQDETVAFKDLKLNVPQSFDFRNIRLVNTSVASEWGLFGENSNVTVENSDGVWPWPVGLGVWKLIKSRMVEFDPRNFRGDIVFDKAIWANAGEIFENTDMKMKGTVKFTENINEHLVLSDSKVTREYPVRVVSKGRKRVKTFSVDVLDGTNIIAHADTADGEALISLSFTPENYKKNLLLKTTIKGKSKTQSVGLFSDTPVLVRY